MVKAALSKAYWLGALILLVCGWARAASVQPITSATSAPQGRIYIFRMVRSFGAHIDDYVTVNGTSVARVSPGNGIYCDVAPGDYLIGVARHKTQPLKVSVTAGQGQYVCVMLHQPGGGAPRKGASTSDQSFDIRLLQPGYGAKRVQEYHLTRATCQP
jgi:hypothetical protein